MPDHPASTPESVPPIPEPTSLPELALLFLRLGLTAFGGPAAHVSLMEEEFVRRRAWLTHAQFLDLLGAANLIPGPNSTEVAIHIGFLRARRVGMAVAGVCFILPAALLVTALAWAYTRYGHLPQVVHILYGVKPVIIAVVAQALWRLAHSAVKSRLLAAMGLLAALLAALGVNELVLLFGVGALAGGAEWSRQPTRSWKPLLGMIAAVAFLLVVPVLLNRSASGTTGFSLPSLFGFFLKVGAVLYGSGYVLLAFLQNDLVNRWHWLTSAQLLDAVAVGQVTPGPLFTTATFIGYLLAGPTGALVATVGIFLPAFVFVALSGPLIPRLRSSVVAGAFLDGVNVASLALMGVVTWHLGRDALRDGLTVALALLSLLLLLRYRVNSAWLVLGGMLVGGLAALRL